MRESWEIRELGEVCKFFRGLTYSKGDEVEKSSKKVLRSNNIDLESNTLVLEEMKYLREDFDIEDDKIVKSNSILICMSNGSKQHIGKVAFIKEPIDYAFGGFMGLIFPDKSICAKYIYYACTSSLFKHFILGIGNGIGITNLRFTDLSNFTLPVPPLSEQERIVAELDCLSSVIEKQKELLKELDNLAQSTFYTMFGDPITNEKGWAVKKLGELIKVIGGYAFKSGLFIDKGIPVLRIGNINTGVLKINPMVFYEEDKKLSKYLVYPNDLVMSLTGTAGKDDYGNVCVLDDTYPKYYLNQRNAKLELSHFLNVQYLKYVLRDNAIKKELTGINRGVRQGNISNKDIERLNILLPHINLQQQFAEKIEAIERQKELIKQSIAETETLFNSRMDYYFN